MNTQTNINESFNKDLNLWFIMSEIDNLSKSGYDSNISYCGLWQLNKLRTKLKIHKILPFNRFCYLHDCGYSILNKYYSFLSLKELRTFKKEIDLIFYQNMLKDIATKHKYKLLYNFIAKSFYYIVRTMTPVYLVGFWYKNRNK